MGGGKRDDIAFPANSQTTFNFPFSIDYTQVRYPVLSRYSLLTPTQAKDPGSAILMDISDRCGFTGNAKRQIRVKYDITLQIRILTFSISPSFSGQAGFDCPLTKDQVAVSAVFLQKLPSVLIPIYLAVPRRDVDWRWIVDYIPWLYVFIDDFSMDFIFLLCYTRSISESACT
jgi:hypothetical protein